MADVMPNYMVEQQRLVSAIAAQRAAIERSKLDILELADRKVRAVESIAASEKAIDHSETNLNSLKKAHGELDKKKFKEMADSV